MTKLSDAQITALTDLHKYNTFQQGTRKTTVQALVKAEMVFESVPFVNGTDHGTYELTNAGREAIGIKTEADGDFTPENIARAIEDIESSESDEAPIIPFFNRAAKREMRRNIARMGRATMRNHGKRIRKYGILLDPKYVARKLAA